MQISRLVTLKNNLVIKRELIFYLHRKKMLFLITAKLSFIKAIYLRQITNLFFNHYLVSLFEFSSRKYLIKS